MEDKSTEERDWAPVELTYEQHFVIVNLCKYHAIGLHKVKGLLNKVVDVTGIDIDGFIAALLATRLVYVYNKRELRLLTEKCRTTIMPDGKYYVADDKTGQLTRWSERFLNPDI